MKLGIYRHFKGALKEVIGVARSSEDTNQEFVVYRSLSGSAPAGHVGDFPEGQLWVRSKEMFLETVERDGKTFPRFEYVGEKLEKAPK